MLMTDEGRERIIQTYVERIDVYDPLPDDPGHCTVDVIVRIHPNGASSEEVRSEIKCAVRIFQEPGHRQKTSSEYRVFCNDIRPCGRVIYDFVI